MPNLTSELARHVASFQKMQLDSRTAIVAKQCVLDWFGVTLAGLDEPVAEILRREIAPNSHGVSTVVGWNLRCAPVDAALINGATSHALDYDDVHPRIGHPTAAILPAALAVGEAQNCTGADVLRAFVAGYEAAAFIGSLVLPSHYDRGFHSTGTLGSFGAAVAAGLLMGLDEAQMAIALGLAGTQAAGLKSMFGTMAKPFHAGRAAANGVLAARLAARGFTASSNVLDAEQGFVVTQSDGPSAGARQLPPMGSVIVDTLFKYHAACYLTHSTMEGVSILRKRLGAQGTEIATIEIHVASGHLSVCNIREPKTGLETKFSLRHAAALAAFGKDTAATDTYSDRMATDPSLAAMRDRVTVHGDRPAGHDAHVAVTTSTGQRAEITVDVGIPESDLTYQGERLSAKFRSLAGAVIGAEHADRLQHRIATLEALPDISALMAV